MLDNNDIKYLEMRLRRKSESSLLEEIQEEYRKIVGSKVAERDFAFGYITSGMTPERLSILHRENG